MTRPRTYDAAGYRQTATGWERRIGERTVQACGERSRAALERLPNE